MTKIGILYLSMLFFISCSPKKDALNSLVEVFGAKQTKELKPKSLAELSNYGLNIEDIELPGTDMSAEGVSALKNALKKQWDLAENSSNQSFHDFLYHQNGKILLHGLRVHLVEESSYSVVLENGLDNKGDIVYPVANSVVRAHRYEFQLTYKWKIESKNGYNMYSTPLKKNIYFSEYNAKDGEVVAGSDIATYYMKSSKTFPSKDDLINSLLAHRGPNKKIYILPGNEQISGDENSLPSSHITNLRKYVFQASCELFYNEMRQDTAPEICKFTENDEAVFEELAYLGDQVDADAPSNFALAAENVALQISNCSNSSGSSDDSDSTALTSYSIFVSSPLSLAINQSIMTRGKPLRLYQPKGEKIAYRVSDRMAVIDKKVDNQFCGAEAQKSGHDCYKALYFPHKKQKKNLNFLPSKCEGILAGNYFLSIKKSPYIRL